MCREVTTKCICDRCKKMVEVPPKKIAGVYRAGKYPDTWSDVHDFHLCETCTNEYNNVFNGFMNVARGRK